MDASITGPTPPRAAPAWARLLNRLNHWLLFDLGGGPRPLKFAWLVDAQKAGSLPLIGLLMFCYADHTPAATSTAAFIYLALHGGYGLVWWLKSLAFPDANWQVRITLPSSGVVAVSLGLYWVPAWLLISGTARRDYPLAESLWLGLCVLICLLGCVIMIAADAQKYFTLRVRRGLITDGMFRFVRHPNYLGEMMIYGSFALLVWHWFPIVLFLAIWLGLFGTNMVMKEASMSRYPEWADYKRRSFWLLPGLF